MYLVLQKLVAFKKTLFVLEIASSNEEKILERLFSS